MHKQTKPPQLKLEWPIVFIFCVIGLVVVFSLWYLQKNPNLSSKNNTNTQNTGVSFSSKNIPVFPGMESYSPQEKLVEAEYFRFTGENKLEEIYDYYHEWVSEKGIISAETKNIDGSWNISVEEADNTFSISAFYQDGTNLLYIQ